ncbi:flagellar type III secretion system protein FlhB [Hyphococcus luteus]|uniref:Flagellar biosynthesis protein FlhB n=1 Tax=Hyphococcus luteus TaxID=2058213 RepID=A0A2S7K8R9_9PROT|nr:flagellar type III secretion system protein FlhB [Marinicaulis flavus]PQA88873.1 flagellar biosynthesis protein FlhB [Marinicaulis flavus]
MSEKPEDSGQEKSHEPTQSRIDKARREGDVAQSKEANAAASYVGFYLALAAASSGAAAALAFHLSQLFDRPEAFAKQAFSGDGSAFIAKLSGVALEAVAPFLILPALGVLASLFAQQAIAFAPSKIQPKFSRLSLVSNAKKKYGPDGLSEFAKSAAKLIAICIMFGAFYAHRFTTLPLDARFPAQGVPQAILREGVIFAGMIVLFSTAIALVDVPWSRHRHNQKLKMTLEELKKETKEQEGDPAMKQNRRERGQAIARNQMMQDVPEADVVIVNPTHYAVALKWDRKGGGAPVCVAKGVDELALKIREVAAVSGVPIRSDPPTARAIHASVEIGDEIQRDQYAAVAAAIHFADAMRKKAGSYGQEQS